MIYQEKELYPEKKKEFNISCGLHDVILVAVHIKIKD